jgi:molybdopterin converting factor subunit 1
MTLTVQLFARVRELAKADRVSMELPEGDTVAGLRHALAERFPQLAAILSVSMIAVNHEFAAETQSLTPADEIAVIPPVSGGCR